MPIMALWPLGIVHTIGLDQGHVLTKGRRITILTGLVLQMLLRFLRIIIH